MRYIDLRSDTVTMPTKEMRQAMANAEVGDDVYGDDPTVNKLEALAAKMVGKEASLFVPSGTMGNQLAVMSHTQRGNEVILGENSHIVVHEAGATAVLSSVQLRTIKSPDDIVYPAAVLNAIRSDDIHEPKTGLICMENALANGTVVPLNIMKEVYNIAKSHDIPVHLDGARLFNAAAYLNVEPSDVAKYADSVMFCLSKGLCAPVGSMLAGTKTFVDKARRNRKILGGAMRQAGILAAAGIIALEEMTKRLKADHENARYMAERLMEIKGIELNINSVQIDMVWFRLSSSIIDPDTLVDKLFEKSIKINGPEGGLYRFVTNNDVSKEDIDYVIECIKELI